MKLKEAVERAEKLDEIQDILSSGGFLCSAYFMLEKDEDPEGWNLAFYSEEKDEITAVEVTEDGTEVGVTDAPLHEETGRIRLEDVKIEAEDALESIREILDEEFSVSHEKILFTLKEEDGEHIWRAVFVGKSLSIVSVALDAETGEVVEKEKKSMGSGSSFAG